MFEVGFNLNSCLVVLGVIFDVDEMNRVLKIVGLVCIVFKILRVLRLVENWLRVVICLLSIKCCIRYCIIIWRFFFFMGEK